MKGLLSGSLVLCTAALWWSCEDHRQVFTPQGSHFRLVAVTQVPSRPDSVVPSYALIDNVRSFQYDEAGKLTSAVTVVRLQGQNPATRFRETYTYNGSDWLVENKAIYETAYFNTLPGAGERRTFEHTGDGKIRKTSVTLLDPLPANSFLNRIDEMTYDGQGRLATLTRMTYSLVSPDPVVTTVLTYTYDPQNNPETIVMASVSKPGFGGASVRRTITYEYDDKPNAFAGTGPTRPTYFLVNFQGLYNEVEFIPTNNPVKRTIVEDGKTSVERITYEYKDGLPVKAVVPGSYFNAGPDLNYTFTFSYSPF